MNLAEDVSLKVIESELIILRRHVQSILTEDLDAVYEAKIVTNSVQRALRDYRLKLQRLHEEAAGTAPPTA
jgi:hypothetical protein